MPPVHNQAVSRYGTGRSGMVRENGPRTTLPYLLRGLTPPSLPCLGDRVIRSFTKTIVDLQRVMLDHRAGRLHGGEQVGQRFPQPNAAMPDPLGLPHRDVTLCDSGRAPTARGDTLHGLTTIRDPGSKGHLEPAMEDTVLKSGPHPTLTTQPPHRDVTSCDRDGAPTAFDIALRDFRDTLDGFQMMPDFGSRSHPEPAMKDAVLESGTHPTLATQLSQYGITLRDSAFDIALRDFRRARAKRRDALPGLATIRGHGSKLSSSRR